MSDNKQKLPDGEEELVINIKANGDAFVGFFPVSFSEFVIDYVYDKKRRESLKEMGIRKIYCG